MNIQSMFNSAYRGITDQGGPAFRIEPNGETMCLYRDKKHNRKCAAGHILPNRSYRKSLETKALGQISWFKNNLTEFETEFLNKVQNVHDGAVDQATNEGDRDDNFDQRFLTIWRSNMESVAAVHNLIIP